MRTRFHNAANVTHPTVHHARFSVIDPGRHGYLYVVTMLLYSGFVWMITDRKHLVYKQIQVPLSLESEYDTLVRWQGRLDT